jgi:hypothetical protein
MIRKLKSIFSKEKKNEEEVKVSLIFNNRRLDISKRDIYDFFIKNGINKPYSGIHICNYFGINPELSQELFKEFSFGNNKILDINKGFDIMSNDHHHNHFTLTKEAMRDIKLSLILNE